MEENVSNLLELATSIYIDTCARCVASVSDLRDLDTLRSRVKDEGLSFLTITLPDFCADFESALSSGQIASTHFRRFRKCGRIPSF
jgi:hypothetical protein